jgi:hypothetical protein
MAPGTDAVLVIGGRHLEGLGPVEQEHHRVGTSRHQSGDAGRIVLDDELVECRRHLVEAPGATGGELVGGFQGRRRDRAAVGKRRLRAPDNDREGAATNDGTVATADRHIVKSTHPAPQQHIVANRMRLPPGRPSPSSVVSKAHTGTIRS